MTFFHSTRLFPKNLGADKYQITGIAAKCDWVFLSDNKTPNTHLKLLSDKAHPQYVYLSLRSPFIAISQFVYSVLPKIKNSFVLISGSEDITIPNQIDKRWRRFSNEENKLIFEILQNQYLVHWFAENIDDQSIEKLSGFPLGMVYPNSQSEMINELEDRVSISERPLKVLCGHRVRDHEQWDIRQDVTQLAINEWTSFTTNLTKEVTESDFFKLIQSHSFVLCVEGGGLDPSPKAWQSLYHGAIPIVRRNATSESYSGLPIAYVESWEHSQISIDKLEHWKQQFSQWFDDPKYRNELLLRLGIDYWWSKITADTFPIVTD